jgi:hypothetical protein
VLLASGADIERLLDAPSAPDAFVRHATRLPFLRLGRECPMVAFAPKQNDLPALLRYRNTLMEAVELLRDATWLLYVTGGVRNPILGAADRHGDLYDCGGGLLVWRVSDGPIGVVGRDTWVPGLSGRLAEHLAPTLESGVMPIETPIGEFRRSHLATTEPAPEGDPSSYVGTPYAAVASRSMSPPTQRRPSPFNSTTAPSIHPTSTLPPNPRLRKG